MKQDLRSLSHDALEEIRIRSVKMVIKLHISNTEVCKLMDIDTTLLSKWMGIYRKGGWKALRSGKNPGGRPKDPEKNLTTSEMKTLEKILLQEPRDIKQLKLDLSLWNATIVGDVIALMFGKTLKEGQIRKILANLGFTCQKPIFRAYQQDLLKVREWREELKPKIEEEAMQEGREILYGDEAGFKSTEHRGTTWGKRGVTPIVKATGARFGVNAISAVSKNGVMRFMTYIDSFSSDTLILFLEKLIYKTESKYTLILDGHPTHKTKKVQEWLEQHTVINTKGEREPQIRLYYLPPYSPELNPDEQVWLHAKGAMKGAIYTSISHIQGSLKKILLSIQKKKGLISSFFRHPEFL